MITSTELWAMKRILSLHSRKEIRIASFPCVSFSGLNFYKRIFLFTPAICKDCTVSRIHYGFLPTYEPWLIPTCDSFLDSHRQQTTFTALRSPLFSPEREMCCMLSIGEAFAFYLSICKLTPKVLPHLVCQISSSLAYSIL